MNGVLGPRRSPFFVCFLFIAMMTAFGIRTAYSQKDVFELMERTDLTLRETEAWADAWFARTGTGQGSGFKQYMRWLYERRFHVNEEGYFINPEDENRAYHVAISRMAPGDNTTQLSWTELGPNAWTYTSGWNPGVGRLTSVALHPSNTSVIYVSSPGGGIWKTTNGGGNWIPLIDHVNSSWMNVFHLVIDPVNPNVIYASLTSGGVLKTVDAGSTWNTTGSGPSTSKQVRIHPDNSNIVFCAASNGIWRSVNGGTSWTQVETSTKEDIEFNPQDPNIMYASGSGGTSCVWRSANNGQTWTAITGSSGITNTGRTLLGVSPAAPNVVYAVQASGSLFGRMYKSTDAGLTYTTTVVGDPASGTNYFGYYTSGTGTTGQAGYDMAICVNPADANEVHIAGIICWKSTNGGLSFTATTVWSYPNSTGYNHADVHALEWVNGTIWSGSDGGIFKSTNNGEDWTDLSAGLGIRQFYRIACAKTDPNVITTGAQDNGSSFRKSNGNWIDWLGADGMDNIISPTNAAVAIGTSQNGSIYKTTNSGTSYSGLTKPADGNWVTPLVMHPTTHDTIYGGWTGVWRSGNGGTSWTNLSPGITVKLDVLAVAPSNTKYIYTSQGSTLYRTTDGGSTWSTQTAPASVTSIFVSKYNPLKIWISCNSSTNRVLVSTDGGAIFTNISSGLPTLSARSVVVDEDAYNAIYVGMNVGVYYRDDNTGAWNQLATGLPLVAINEVEIQKSGNKLRVATYGRGIWETDLAGVLIANPTGFSAVAASTSQIDLAWVKNAGNNPVIIAWSSTGTFGCPINGTAYPPGSAIPGGGTVLFSGSGTSYNHTNLTPGTTYFYRAWSVDGSNAYSFGTSVSGETFCSSVNTFPWNEGFANGVQPACWSQVDNQANGQIWQFGTLSGYTPLPALNGNYAYLNSDGYGSTNSQNADLISPVFDFTGYTQVTLSFNHYFRSYSGSSGKVSYSINNGATWTVLATFTETSATNPAIFSQVIAAAAGQPSVKFKWNYTGTWGYYWGIDEVQVAATCLPVPVGITITASANPVNQGTAVTFTATPVNGGSTPGYQWRVNAVAVPGATLATYTCTPTDGMAVECLLFSNAFCATGNPAVSNTIIMTVNVVAMNEVLQNITISNDQTGCYDAIQTITVAGGNTTFTVLDGGSATMIAGVSICYLPGTLAEAGGSMLGYITQDGQYCGSTILMPLVAASVAETDLPVSQKPFFKIYPNPSSGTFTLEFPQTGFPQNLSAFICDIRGNKILDIRSGGQNKQTISLENQPNGMYFIRVFTEKQSESAKILKQ